MRKLRILALLCALLMVLSGCSLIAVIPGNTQTEEIAVPKPEESTASAVPEESTPDAEPSAVPEEDTTEAEASEEPEIEEPTVPDVPEEDNIPVEEPTAPETTGSPALDVLRECIRAEGKLFGVAYLGGFEGDEQTALEALFGQAYLDDIAFVRDVEQYVVQDGWQMYCIVPVDDTVSLSICEYVFEEVPCVGKELLFTNGLVLLRGNVSDIVPNLCIIATKGAQRVEYCPMQSGMDGTLVDSGDLIFDFTPYPKMPEFSWLHDTTE